ncbi:hypothetical protein CCR96_13570 [Halochromatium roseum]|nr:hypothetical protein [Halochromatium roseum]
MTQQRLVAGLSSAAELPANFADEARFLLAVKLFEQGRISSGKAGRLCDMGRIFLFFAPVERQAAGNRPHARQTR